MFPSDFYKNKMGFNDAFNIKFQLVLQMAQYLNLVETLDCYILVLYPITLIFYQRKSQQSLHLEHKLKLDLVLD